MEQYFTIADGNCNAGSREVQAMIHLRIEQESDLYNKFDPYQNKLNDDLYRYLKSYCTELEFKRNNHDTL